MVAFLVAVVVLQQIGIDVRALLVSAGVLGVAIGLGAQSLIRDVILGVFILLENLIAVGDVIEVGQHTGVVESVGLRVTKIRKFPASSASSRTGADRVRPSHRRVGLPGRGGSIDYEEDVDRALRALGEVGKALAASHPGAVLEPATAEGILRFGQSGAAEAVLRLHARVVALEKAPLEFEARRRVKEAFAAHGIRAPRAAMEVRLTPPSGGASVEDSRKESVA
jgi:small conductance mechanosensitive channel